MHFYHCALYSTNAIGCWDMYLLWRQRRSCFHESVPTACVKLLSAEEYAKSQAYGRDKATLGLVEQAVNLASANIRLLGRLSAKLYKWTSTMTGFALGSFTHCLAFSILDDAIATVISIPLEYCRHFIVEERHGFNKMTRREFAMDTVKAFLLRATLLYPIQTILIQWVVRRFGESFPLFFFLATAAVAMAFSFLYPTFIMPLFNTFSDLDPDCQLYRKIAVTAERVGFPLTRIYTMDGSRRSHHSNAFFFGLWKQKRIVLFDTLIEQVGDNDEQVVAVLAHELGHWKLGHTHALLGAGLGQLLAFSFAAKAVIFNEAMYHQFGFTVMDPVIGFEIYSQAFLQPFHTLLGYAMTALSRRFEFQADQFAVSLGYRQELAAALVVIAKESRADMTPDPLCSALLHTHPPVVERLTALTDIGPDTAQHEGKRKNE